MEINWEEAPEGTTHHLKSAFTNHWLKKLEDRYWYCLMGAQGWSTNSSEWAVEYENPALYTLTVRPLVEAPLPDGWEWPEKATHFNPQCGGFFINEREDTYLHKGPDWKKFTENDTLDYWLKSPETISRYANVNKPGQPKPAPKKQVGWWS